MILCGRHFGLPVRKATGGFVGDQSAGRGSTFQLQGQLDLLAALAKMTLRNLLAEYPGELVRFFVLSTHYRRPIEYTPEEFDSKRKGLDTFYRLFERVDRLAGCPYQAADEEASDEATKRPGHEGKVAAPAGRQGAPGIDNLKSQISNLSSAELRSAFQEALDRFTEAMDDDFNTAGAIAALFDYAGAINRFVEQNKLESLDESARSNARGALDDALHAAAGLILLGRLIGLFLEPQRKKAAAGGDAADRAMQVLIKIRQHLRKKKDFETADLIRNLLAEQKITLEDRPDGTVWRVD